MGSAKDLLSRINGKYGSLSRGQRLLAVYITENYDKAAFLTAAKLGQAVGVSESTVVRFAAHLGYKGYPEFQHALGELVQGKLHDVHQMEDVYGRISQPEILETVLKSDIGRLQDTLEHMDAHAFDMAVDILVQAKCIYVLGIRNCAPLAEFLAFYLNMAAEDVRLLRTSSSSELLEQMVHIGKGDAMVGISFPRYSIRTLKAMELANSRSASVITLTDSVHSPLNLYSSCNLIAKSDMSSVLDSLTAPMSVINALLLAVCMKKQGEVAKTLELLEQVWEEYQINGNDEINYMKHG